MTFIMLQGVEEQRASPNPETLWVLPEVEGDAVKGLSESLGVTKTLAQILLNRGLKDPVDARRFLTCQLRDLTDPFLLPDMTPGVERVWRAIENRETIALYGDYDVDGVTSVAIMHRVLKALKAERVVPFLPDRFDEGYGLTRAGIDRCLAGDVPKLIIVLDCGTNSVEEVRVLADRRIDVVILDHHEPSSPAKPLALVNYKLGHSKNWEAEYCTAGLVFKFCHALLKHGRGKGKSVAKDLDLRDHLDLVALATIADIAPLRGENRILTRHGLRQMAQTRSPGLKALIQVSGIRGEPSGYDCGFRLGPRLNAAGRLESAMASLQLLLSDEDSEVREIADRLDGTNRERQAEEARVFAEAREMAQDQAGREGCRVMVVAGRDWHEGVVGIVASRLVREFYLPAFVISLNGEGRGKGSGRSIEGFCLATAVQATRSFLLKGGGHSMAAGISIEGAQVESWREALQVHARVDQGLEGDRLKRMVRIDVEVGMEDLTFGVLEELQKLEPCGMGNPRPVLLVRHVEMVSDARTVGADKKHLKLTLKQGRGRMDAIAFGRGALSSRAVKGSRWDLVFELEKNEFMGATKLQLNIREMMESRT